MHHGARAPFNVHKIGIADWLAKSRIAEVEGLQSQMRDGKYTPEKRSVTWRADAVMQAQIVRRWVPIQP